MHALRIAFISIALTAGASAQDPPTGEYVLTEIFQYKDGSIDPQIQIQPVHIDKDGDFLVLERAGGIPGKATKAKLFISEKHVVFFITPESNEAFKGSAIGEMYRGQWDGKAITGTKFHDRDTIWKFKLAPYTPLRKRE